MAAIPNFATTPREGVVSVSTANTARDGTGTIATVLTAGASGTKIDEITLAATADPADSTVTLFIHDGTTAQYFDEIDLGDPAAGSATLAPYRSTKAYANLVLPTGFSLRAAITVALTSGVMKVHAHGADF